VNCRTTAALRGRPVIPTVIMAAAMAVTVPLRAQLPPDPIPAPVTPNTVTGGFNTLTGSLRAQATPDECWNGIGQNTLWDYVNQANPLQPCPAGQIPKVNQGYVWGTVQIGNLIFFGTVANGQCIGEAAFYTNNPTGQPAPYQTNSWACEFGQSAYSNLKWQSLLALPPILADFRPPRFYVYSLTDHTIKDITPKLGGSPGAYCSASGLGTPLCIDALWLRVRGVRTATSFNGTGPDGTLHNYVLVSGPSLTGALSFFALDITGITSPSQFTNANWVAEYNYTNLSDQRHWISYDGVLYAPSAKSAAAGGAGAVMQFTGNFTGIPAITPGPANGYKAIPNCGTLDQHIPPVPQPATSGVCFAFQQVGSLPDSVATDAALHTEINPATGLSDTRIFVATWPPPGVAGLYMSPAIPAGGFGQPNPTPANWTKVWQMTDYDPDPLVASTIGTGALADFQGQLYWGTMVYPYAGTANWLKTYNPDHTLTPDQLTAAVVNTFRAATLFSATGFLTGTPQINLLYGQSVFEVFNGQPGTDGDWVATPNNMGGVAPVYGLSGFGNPYNNYVWTMTAFNGKLYLGTMDWGYSAVDASPLVLQSAGQPVPIFLNRLIPPQAYGADLYSFADASSPAIPESINGMGNFLAYGIRALFPNGNTSLMIGTANPMNLSTGMLPYGGWALIEAVPASQNKGR